MQTGGLVGNRLLIFVLDVDPLMDFVVWRYFHA